MAGKKRRGVTRRDFLKATGAGALAAGLGPFFLFPERAQAQPKTLKILQWGHFVPGYDKWFDGVFAREWGLKHDTRVIVDHISSNEVAARAAAEAAAGKGHDLFMFLAPPAAYDKRVIDLREVYQEVERKHDKVIPMGHKSTFNPKTKKHFAFSDSYAADPGNWRKDLWEKVGYPQGPDTYDDLRAGAKRIRDNFGNPCGIGLSSEQDSNMALRALLWSFGGSVQDENGSVVIYSRNTIEALKYMRAVFKESETDEVFTWDPSSNNRAMLAGRLSYTMNAISITREAERENSAYNSRIWLSPALKGPARRYAAAHVMNCYVVWEFAENKEGAKQFLVDLIGQYAAAFRASEFYNLPCFPGSVPDFDAQIANDPQSNPPGKYKVLATAREWTTNVGYPGYATAAIDEVFNTFVLPTMFAKVAKDQMSAEDAARAAEREIKRIFDRWK